MENKKQVVFNSEISMSEENILETKGKGRPFTSRFIEAGITHYREFGDILITKETLDRFIHTMVGCPVVINHKEITDNNVDKERVGVISKVWFEPMDGWYWCEGIIWDKQAIDLVKNQGWNVSCTYDFVSDKQNKTHNGKKIDMEFIDGEFLHLALVENPRYERANIVINSKDDEIETVDNEDKWITVKPNGEDEKGRHLLLKDGESPKEAMKRQWGIDLDKKGKEEKENKVTSIFDYKFKNEDLMEKFISKFQTGNDYLSLYKASRMFSAMNKTYIEKNLGQKLSDKEFTDFKEDVKYLADKGNEALKEEPKEEKTTSKKEELINKFIKSPEVQKHLRESVKASKAEGNSKIGETAIDSDRYISLFADKISSDDYNNNFNFNDFENAMFEELHRIEKENGFNNEQSKEEKKESNIDKFQKLQKELKGKFKNYKEMTPDELLKARAEIGKVNRDIMDITISGEDKENNKKLNEIHQDLMNFGDELTRENNRKIKEAQQPKEDKQKANNTTDRKENIVMTVLNDLTDFIKGIVSNAVAENEDKRAVIDEIGGILKDKLDEEVWRTVIGKIEKIAYEPSETDKADNKKAKNEEDKEKEEILEEEIENEEEDKKEEKEDKKEAKEDKKEVENKKCAKNSMEDVKNAVLGGSTRKVKIAYNSLENRLKAGENY